MSENPAPDLVAALPPSYSRIELATVTARTQANLLGNIHGGEIVKLADSTAGVVAQRHSGGPAVTAALDEMSFRAPVRVGDIVRTRAQVNGVGSSSMEIGVRIETQPWDDASTEFLHVGSAYFLFVAIDTAGHPRPVPGLAPETADDERRMREAQIRREHRIARRAAIEAGRLSQA
ncbi:acyl-CoA thioesterase [Nocardioides sp. GY 10113]|uniref:acyl-CoA thioesterase n=1 Tax=Nocardioides sp. GY 10113 TaxID=2569761 RepID=UPI0010A76AFF|nr:acyl-CoA thioesterase [Nocardioides sp. GY 10113]TIC87891.1 acyl-CoA thioesterase [Nocardioides sp. GY 10113]